MKFIVIEGDNGTGKDTLAQQLENNGFNIVTYEPKIKNAEKIAKRFSGEEKVKMFLGYNKLCSDIIKENRSSNQNVVLVRYWVSSLAAAFADGIYKYDETIKKMKEIMCKLENPDKVIRLKCNFDERIRRIEERNSENYDDKTLQRDLRYQFITDKIKKESNMKWFDIDTTGKSKKEIFEEVSNILGIDVREL